MSKRTLYVGIDVSKKALEVATTVDGKEAEATKEIMNNLGGFRMLEEWTRKQSHKHGCEEIHYCIESTGVYSEKVVEYLQGRGDLMVSVVNPFVVKSFGKSLGVRTKTDRVDSELLALYAATVKPKVTEKRPEDLKELRSLVRHLEYLINRRGQEAGRLESTTNALVADSIKGIIKSYDKQIEKIKEAIEEHLRKHPDLRERTELLESIPGIGEITSKILLCELHMEGGGERISAKAQTAHAGLAPQHRISGSSVRGKPRICKTGNSRLRRCLYFPTMVAIKHNPVIRRFYRRMLENGKPKMVALVAAMRKLLVIAIGVLNNRTEFAENWDGREYA
ncbi:MAG: transposase family protein [Candidatus Dadabacteria bacterium]|nr:transposase family protein [Candidatus Dadabacteria bacterium]